MNEDAITADFGEIQRPLGNITNKHVPENQTRKLINSQKDIQNHNSFEE